jgi:hypothetical protein
MIATAVRNRFMRAKVYLAHLRGVKFVSFSTPFVLYANRTPSSYAQAVSSPPTPGMRRPPLLHLWRGALGRPLSGRSRGTDVPMRIFLISFANLAECVIPD